MTSHSSLDGVAQGDGTGQNGASTPQGTEEKSISPDVNKSQRKDSSYLRWKVHIASIVTLLLAFTATLMAIQFMSQYVYYRVGLKYFNSSTHSKSQSVPCDVNGTLEDRQLQQRVQKEATYLQLCFVLAASLPAVVVNVFMGSYSDVLGRKMMFFLPIGGSIGRSTALVVVVYLELDLYILFPLFALEGFCGGPSLLLEAVFVVNADVTPPKEKRTVVIAVIEGFQMLSSSLSSLVIGLLILHLGYEIPSVTMLAMQTVGLVISMVFIPNTAPGKREQKTLSPLHHVKNFMSFYLKGHRHRRLQYRLAVSALFLTLLNILGSLGVTTLYQLNRPFCWNAAYIGYFGAAQRGLTALVSTTFVATATRCLSLEMIAVLGLVSGIAALVLEGLAVNDVMLYLVTVVGMLSNAPAAVCRILMSKWTPPEKQGAIFSGIAVVQGVCYAISNALFNAIYAATLSVFRGLVFLIMAGVFVVAAALMLWLRHISAHDHVADDVTIKVDLGDLNGGNSESKEKSQKIDNSQRI